MVAASEILESAGNALATHGLLIIHMTHNVILIYGKGRQQWKYSINTCGYGVTYKILSGGKCRKHRHVGERRL